MNSILYRSILQDAFVEKVWEDDKLEVSISSFNASFHTGKGVFFA